MSLVPLSFLTLVSLSNCLCEHHKFRINQIQHNSTQSKLSLPFISLPSALLQQTSAVLKSLQPRPVLSYRYYVGENVGPCLHWDFFPPCLLGCLGIPSWFGLGCNIKYPRFGTIPFSTLQIRHVLSICSQTSAQVDREELEALCWKETWSKGWGENEEYGVGTHYGGKRGINSARVTEALVHQGDLPLPRMQGQGYLSSGLGAQFWESGHPYEGLCNSQSLCCLAGVSSSSSTPRGHRHCRMRFLRLYCTVLQTCLLLAFLRCFFAQFCLFFPETRSHLCKNNPAVSALPQVHICKYSSFFSTENPVRSCLMI